MPQVKMTNTNQQTVKLQRGNKIIERTMVDYKINKKNYDFRGFKIYEEVKEEVKKPKRRTTKKD